MGFEVLTPVVMKSSFFWNIMPCGPLEVVSEKHVACIFRAVFATYFHPGFWLRLFFDTEDEGDMFLRNAR
jgi:hypothetical protein